MSDYRDPAPIVILPPRKQASTTAPPLYPDKWPEFVIPDLKEVCGE